MICYNGCIVVAKLYVLMSHNLHLLSAFTGVMHWDMDSLLALCDAEPHLPATRVGIFLTQNNSLSSLVPEFDCFFSGTQSWVCCNETRDSDSSRHCSGCTKRRLV